MIFIRTIEPNRQDSATESWHAANLTHVNWVLVPDQIGPLVLHSGDILAHWQLALLLPHTTIYHYIAAHLKHC